MAYADQYVVYDYWVTGYAVGDVTATDAAGSINGAGTISGFGGLLQNADGSINGIGTIAGAANIVAVGDVVLIGIGTVDVTGNAVFVASGSINGTASIIAIGYRLGEEWSDSAVNSNTWSEL